MSVIHPYHSEYLDAPNYLFPREVTVAEGASLPDFPESILARKIVSDPLPQTDLALRSSPVLTGEYMWWIPESTPEPMGENVILGPKDVAIETSRAFLAEHGLWSEIYEEPAVTVGSSESGGSDGYLITSWLVRFPGETIAEGIEQYVTLRVGHENRVVGVTLFIPRLEVLKDRYLRLRPVTDLMDDLEAWRDGDSRDLQNKRTGPVKVEVRNVSLEYEDPGSRGEPIAVPVYVFDVVVDNILEGSWAVVAAADVRSEVASESPQTSEPMEGSGKTLIRTGGPVSTRWPSGLSAVLARQGNDLLLIDAQGMVFKETGLASTMLDTDGSPEFSFALSPQWWHTPARRQRDALSRVTRRDEREVDGVVPT